MRRPTLAFLLTAGSLLLAGLPARAAAQGPDLIILVRHAETDPDGTGDPPLSTAGLARAAGLAAMLEDAGLTQVHSTEYRRTRRTAAAVAGALDLQVTGYDPRALPAFAGRLLALPGRHLVVGHSNTTPALVRLLGGDPGPPITEHEHGRMYVLVPGPGRLETLVVRY